MGYLRYLRVTLGLKSNPSEAADVCVNNGNKGSGAHSALYVMKMRKLLFDLVGNVDAFFTRFDQASTYAAALAGLFPFVELKKLVTDLHLFQLYAEVVCCNVRCAPGARPIVWLSDLGNSRDEFAWLELEQEADAKSASDGKEAKAESKAGTPATPLSGAVCSLPRLI